MLFLDVKPENMAVGNSNKNQIFFFDFAFSTFHSDALGVPKKRVKVSSYDGTPEYMARGPLNRYSHVRKDDFIAFGLVMLELSGVDLPWLDKTSDDHSMEEVMDIVLEEWDKHGTEVSNHSNHIVPIQSNFCFQFLRPGHLRRIWQSGIVHKIFQLF